MPGKNRHTLTVEAAAALMGIGRNSAYEAIRENRFPVRIIKVGSRYLIPRADLESLLGIPRHES